MIADNSANLVKIYDRILGGDIGPIGQTRRTRIESRRADCFQAEINARQRATRIRSGLG